MHKPLWSVAAIASLLGGTVRALPDGAGDQSVLGLQIDSREVIAGDLFIAMPGTDTDGHAYIAQAFERGAVAALVAEDAPIDAPVEALIEEDLLKRHKGHLIVVPDVIAALNCLATSAVDRSDAKRIAVTGSAGKTSVVHALKRALSGDKKAHSSIRSFNNHVGVPLSLSRMPEDSRYGIFEVGMSAPNEIAALSALVQPDVAVITSIGAAHIGAFRDESAIAEEKASIVAGMRSGGTLVVGDNHPYIDIIRAKAAERDVRLIVASLDFGQGDIHPVRIVEHRHCTCMTVQLNQTLLTLKINQPGAEWAMNALLILGAVYALEADVTRAALTLASLQVEPGRGGVYNLDMGSGYVLLQDDSYNANPLSMQAAIHRFGKLGADSKGRKIAVLGDMGELGDLANDAHMALIPILKQAGVTHLLTVGPMMAKMAEVSGLKAQSFDHVDQVIAFINTELHMADQLLVKGSNKHRLGQLVDWLQARSEEEISMISGGRNSAPFAAE